MKSFTTNRHEPTRTNFYRSWLILGIFLFSAIPVPAQASQPWWYLLEQGKFHFRGGSYGNALIVFEDARRGRLNHFTRLEQDFIRLLSRPDVRRYGDSLEFVEKYIEENKEIEAAAALAELYHRIPKNSLNDSVKRALEELDRQKAYAEAEYWIAETYRAEGELLLAFRQYQRAWELRGLFETPGFEAEILYQIANIHRLRREYVEMEKRAKEIIEGKDLSGANRDSFWAGPASNQTRAAMIRILENEGIGRFLTIYRHNNTVTERAHRLLGFFYYASNRHIPAAEHLMFAFLIQNTLLLEDALRREYDYSFTTLQDLINKVRSMPEHEAFIEGMEYYRTAHYLATALYASGKTKPAMELWTFLASSSDAGEWGQRARRNRTPVLDRAVEMP